jgi:hypothetical protein
MVKAAGKQLTSRPTATAPVVDSTQLEAAIVEEADQTFPMVEGIADCLRQRGPTGQAGQQFRQPGVQGLDQRTTVLQSRIPQWSQLSG